MTMIPKAIGLLALTVLPSHAAPRGEGGSDLLAIRVGKAETISQGTLEHVVILVEGGKIVTIGEDLLIERGIPILDRPDWTAMPGLVSCHTRIGLEKSTSRSFEPNTNPKREVYPRQKVWKELLELGVTTLGIVPGGNSGVPGQAIAIRPYGDTVDEMLLEEGVYLKMNLQSSSASKAIIRDAFGKVDTYNEKVAKAREKWDKAREKSKKKSSRSRSKKSKDEDKKEDDDKGKEKPKSTEELPKEFVPPAPDVKVQPFIDLREGRLTAMLSIRKAGDYLHLLDVMDEEEDVKWFLRVPLRTDIDLYEVADRLGEREVLAVLSTRITLQAHSRRERNIPAELARTGVHLALTPESDRMSSYEEWMNDVGHLVSRGLDREKALAAVTQEPARALGLDEQLGTLDAGKDANIVFWDGDPLEPASRVQAVMLEGRFVTGEVD